MKYSIIAAAALCVLSTAATADPVDGLWKTEPNEDGNYLQVSIQPCGSATCGTIDSAFDGSGDQVLDYEHLGKQMIWDMTPEGDGAYGGGKIWAPDKDKTYNSKMSLNGQNQLTVKGCVAGGLVCRGQTWTRVQ